MMIPMINLKKQFEDIRPEIVAAIVEVLESTRYVLGPKVKELEDKMSAYIGVSDVVSVASGTDAIHLSLKALGIGEGDEVITTPFTFFATVESILYVGASPVFADIETKTFNIDPSGIEEKITQRTKAILPVHMFGHPAEMGRIKEIAGKHGLKVIEDCAQAFGATLNEKKVGGHGDAGCFSFYPSKNLGAFGDGGMITIKERQTADRIVGLRNHGSKGGYLHEEIGFNSRLDELQAAVLLVKMKRIDQYNEARRRKARLYSEILSGTIACPTERQDSCHVYHQYTIMSPKRDEIKRRLEEREIASTIYYPVPLHLQPALAFMEHKKGAFPNAEEAAEKVLSLPICPEIEDEDVERIAGIVLDV